MDVQECVTKGDNQKTKNRTEESIYKGCYLLKFKIFSNLRNLISRLTIKILR